jgi:hypothetical protein
MGAFITLEVISIFFTWLTSSQPTLLSAFNVWPAGASQFLLGLQKL